MSLVPMRSILEATEKYNYAQGAFNVNAVAQAKAVIEVHEMFRSAAIIQGADLANAFMGGRTDFANGTLEDKKIGANNIAKAVKKYAENSPIPVALHLDHGKTVESCVAAMDGGYTSVMIDGSSLPFEDNIALTREVVKLAHARGVTIEGELGVLAGVEDHVFAATSTYTNPLDAIRFIKATGVDALAISYGTKHGANKGANAVIRKEIAIATKECLRHEGIFCALVSHGSSTVPQYIVKEINDLGGTITNAYGIPKNQLKEVSKLRELFWYHPELREHEAIRPIYELLQTRTSDFDPRVFLTPIMDTVMYGTVPNEDVARITEAIEKGVKEAVGTLIVDFDSYGKAPLVEQVTLDEMAERYRKAGI